LCDVGRVAVKHCFKLLSFLHLSPDNDDDDDMRLPVPKFDSTGEEEALKWRIGVTLTYRLCMHVCAKSTKKCSVHVTIRAVRRRTGGRRRRWVVL